MEEISKDLHPVMLTVNKLSERENNLLKCEGICIFILNTILNANNGLTIELKSLKRQIDDRRNMNISVVFFKLAPTLNLMNILYFSKHLIYSLIKEFFLNSITMANRAKMN